MPTLLLVRPDNRQAHDSHIAQSAGWQVLPFATMALRPLDNLPDQIAQHIDHAAAIFWVSPSAVEIAAPHIPHAPHITHIAVGQATARALKSAGCFSVQAPSQQHDSEAVLRLPIWQQLPPRAHILIIRGTSGREYLAEQLQQQGFQIHYIAAYERIAQTPNWQAFATQNVQAAWVTSSQMAHELLTQAPPPYTQKLKSLLYLTHHERIADTLRHYGISSIAVQPDLATALSFAAMHVYTENDS